MRVPRSRLSRSARSSSVSAREAPIGRRRVISVSLSVHVSCSAGLPRELELVGLREHALVRVRVVGGRERRQLRIAGSAFSASRCFSFAAIPASSAWKSRRCAVAAATSSSSCARAGRRDVGADVLADRERLVGGRADQSRSCSSRSSARLLQLIERPARPRASCDSTRMQVGARQPLRLGERADLPERRSAPARAGASRPAPAASRGPTRSTRRRASCPALTSLERLLDAARPRAPSRAASISFGYRSDVVGERDRDLGLRGVAVVEELDARRPGANMSGSSGDSRVYARLPPTCGTRASSAASACAIATSISRDAAAHRRRRLRPRAPRPASAVSPPCDEQRVELLLEGEPCPSAAASRSGAGCGAGCARAGVTARSASARVSRSRHAPDQSTGRATTPAPRTLEMMTTADLSARLTASGHET